MGEKQTAEEWLWWLAKLLRETQRISGGDFKNGEGWALIQIDDSFAYDIAGDAEYYAGELGAARILAMRERTGKGDAW